MISVFIVLLNLHLAKAVSCCGSNVSTPAMITTGEKYKLAYSYSLSERIFEVGQDQMPILLKRPISFSRQLFKLGYNGAKRFQYFSQLSLQDSSLGDSEIGLGYDLESSELDHSYVWLSESLPTGISLYQTKGPSDLPTGSGYYASNFGLMIGKMYEWGDAGASISIQHPMPYPVQGMEIRNDDSYSISVGIGRSFGKWRYGLQQGGVYSSSSLSWPSQINGSVLDGPRIWTFSYSDETLFGPVKNVALNRSVGLSFITRSFK